MMIPGILTLVPSFLWVNKLGLLNSPWVLILPYVAGGQIMAIFLFKGFFEGLPPTTRGCAEQTKNVPLPGPAASRISCCIGWVNLSKPIASSMISAASLAVSGW
jgi:hypothetical protein